MFETDRDIKIRKLRKIPSRHLEGIWPSRFMDRGGLSRAGRALDKHGNRPGSLFPKATGSSAAKNAQGQFQLDDILTSPGSTVIRDGKRGFEIFAPDGRGAYFYIDGSFRGFIHSNGKVLF